MRRWIAIILLGGVLTHLFYSSGFLIDYYANTDMFLALCENKDKPQMKCDGKCILAQKLAASSHEKQQSNDTLPPIPPVSLHYLVSTFEIQHKLISDQLVHRGNWVEFSVKELIVKLFKPPI